MKIKPLLPDKSHYVNFIEKKSEQDKFAVAYHCESILN